VLSLSSKLAARGGQAARAFGSGAKARNTGILAMEMYVPNRYVAQDALEKADGVSAGKYTIGLGQKRMAFVDDREDINSICLTAVQRLLDNYGLDPKQIGRLEVGTESLVDKSKSSKTSVGRIFEEAGNTDMEGATVMNACYGGTAALFNSVAWVESAEWDGRYAIFVAADIAVYDKGAARPTGGVAPSRASWARRHRCAWCRARAPAIRWMCTTSTSLSSRPSTPPWTAR
jgi:hydroxymethylglutaryl-CoA synthase